MTTTTLASLADINNTFPHYALTALKRDHLLDSLEDIFDEGHDLILVDGVEGIGKTILLAQFTLRFPTTAFALFVRSASKWAHDPELLQLELCNQMHWVVTGEQLQSVRDVDPSLYRDTLIHLQRRARKTRQLMYFILDGLDELTRSAPTTIPALLELLPFGYPTYRFIITGSQRDLQFSPNTQLSLKEFRVPAFSTDDVKVFLDVPDIDSNDLRSIHKICRGIPGRLASLKRLLARGLTLADLLHDPRQNADLFEVECRYIRSMPSGTQLLLAIVVHDRIARTVTELAAITSREVEAVRDAITSVNFMIVDADTDEVTLASDALREAVAQTVKSQGRAVLDLLIAHALREPDGNYALRFAPLYLYESGQHEQLLDFLNTERFERLIHGSRSLALPKQRGDLVLMTALALARPKDMLRLGIQQACVREFETERVWNTELKALIALHDYDAALNVANRRFLKEDRLHALAVIARELKRAKLPLSQDLRQEIDVLATEIDFRALGRRAAEIAADLIHSLPSLAIRIAEQSNWDETDNPDWEITNLSLASTPDEVDDDAARALTGLRSRIQDPVLRLLARHGATIANSLTADQVLHDIAALDNPADRLFLLKSWAKENPTAQDAVSIVRAALELLVATTDYRPSLADIRKIATPLPYANGTEDLRPLVSELHEQACALEAIGPTDEYVRLQLILARTERFYDKATAHKRILDTYFYIASVQADDTRAAVLAWLLRSLPEVDPDGELERTDGLHSIVEQELRAVVASLLSQAADHVLVMRPILSALAKTQLPLALEFAQKLNTEPRRDLALRATLDAAVHMSNTADQLAVIHTALARFADNEIRDSFVAHALRVLADMTSITFSHTDIELFCRAALDVSNSTARCEALSAAIRIAHTFEPADPKLSEQLSASLRHTWDEIADPWAKIESGMSIVTELAVSDQDSAREYLRAVQSEQHGMRLDSAVRARVFTTCLQLVLRAFGGLLPRQADTESERRYVLELIGLVPSPIVRAILLNDLACRYLAAGRIEHGRELVERELRGLASAMRDDKETYYSILAACAPACVAAFPDATFTDLAALPSEMRDDALRAVVSFAITKLPALEPHDRDLASSVGYDDVLAVLTIIEHIERDDTIYYCIERLLNASKQRLTEQQAISVSERLERIIVTKFPAPRYIQHLGYATLSRAHALALRRQTKLSDWTPLIDAARGVPNTADRVFVEGILASVIPNKFEHERQQLAEEALSKIDDVPTAVDRASRFETLASSLATVVPSVAREALKRGFKTTISGTANDDNEALIRKLVDTAYKIDPALAESLAQLADDDPIRKTHATRLKDRLSANKLKEAFIDGRRGENKLKPDERNTWPTASWMLLRAVNNGRVSFVDPKTIRNLIRDGATLPISRSYPAFAAVIAATTSKYQRDSANASKYVRPLFDAAVASANLTYKLATGEIAPAAPTSTRTSRSQVVGAQARPAALNVITRWLEASTASHIVICDPYFSPNDLDLLRLVQEYLPMCRIEILTSRRHLSRTAQRRVVADEYREAWKAITDDSPPDADIFVVGMATNGLLPIHDRWWLADKSGLRFGTSASGLGHVRVSEISQMDEVETTAALEQVNPYLRRALREHEGIAIVYEVFSL